MKLNVWGRYGCSLAALAAGVVCASSAYAQEQVQNEAGRSATSAPVRQNSDDIDIVVTATKREQRLQDVGVTVTAIGAVQLERLRVNSLADIAAVVPGLNFAQTHNGTPVYTLRGVGFYDSSLSAYPDVATYIDQFPLPFPETSTLAAFDVERIEVLKGPQGTLFGNNATGGAINFIAAKPKNTFDAGGSIGYARFNTFDASGYVTGPVTDTLNARLAFKIVRGDEWQKSYTRNDRNGLTNTTAARLLLDWSPSDRLTVSLNINGWLNRSDSQAPQLFRRVPQFQVGDTGLGGTLTADAPILNYPLAPQTPRAADWDPLHQPMQRNTFWQTAGRIDYELTDDLSVTSLTSYLQTRVHTNNNYDGVDLSDYQIVDRRGSINAFSQEVRLSNSAASPLHFVVGANFDSSQTHDLANTLGYGGTNHYVIAVCCSVYLSDQTQKNYAAFGNIEYRLADQWTFKAGIRRTRAQATAVSAAQQIISDEGDFGEPISITEFFNRTWSSLNFIYPNYRPISPGQPFTIDNRLGPDGRPLDPATYGTAGAYRGRLSQSSTSWTLGLDYKPADDVLLYGLVSKGYKAGGFPTVSAATWSQLEPVTQENLIDYEVGFKTQFADRAITLNGAAFFYDYTDKQTRAKIVDGIFGLLDALVNVPKSQVWGAEFELGVRPIEGLSAHVAGTYLQSKIKTYNGVVGRTVDPATNLFVPVTADYSGVELAFAPEFQITGTIDYEQPVSDNLIGAIGVNVNAQTKSYALLALAEADKENYAINGRAIFGATMGLRSNDGRYALSVWGKNIFNKYYVTNSVLGYDNQIRYAGRPAEYGVSFSFKFN